MSNEEKIQAIWYWQNKVPFHPLTCGVQSSHAELVGQEKDGNVILVCPTCGYEQDYVPSVVYTTYENREELERLGIVKRDRP